MDSQDLSAPSAAKSSRRGKASSPKQDPSVVKELLSISVSSKAFNVYVKQPDPAVDVASFALTDASASSTGGVTFVFSSSYKGTVLVTFKLGKGIASLSSSTLNFSAVSNNQQTLSLTSPASSSSDGSGYAFTVNFSSGAKHDPQIIVTPIGGQPGSQSKRLPAKRKPTPKAPTKAKAKAPAKAKRGGPARKTKR